MYIDILRRLRDAVRNKRREKRRNEFVSHSRQFSSTPVGFGQGFLSKELRDDSGESPLLSWTGCGWFLPVLSIENLHWRKECDGRAEKAFTKWLPRVFPTAWKSLTGLYSCTRVLCWKKLSLNDRTVLFLFLRH